MLVDVFSKGITGKVAEAALGKAGITVNKNAIPFDQNPPMVASGIRIGTPAVTTRGMREAEMDMHRRAHRARAEDARRRARARRWSGPKSRGCAGSSRCIRSTSGPSRPRSDRPSTACSRPADRCLACSTSSRAPARSRWRRRSRASSSDGGVLLAEAGTGTGKTLAYLVPAILSRQRVLVSTGTKNLQEQIYFKDIPALREALGVPFTATYMKGRANYLCLHRLDQLHDGAGPAVARRVPADRFASGRAAPRPATAPSSRICPRISPFWNEVVGDRRDLPRHANARASTTASSRGCASAPPSPTW